MVNTELTITITDASGASKTLDSHAPNPADRPSGLQFATQIQSGFYTAGFALTRAIDSDNADINLGDDVRVTLANGDTVYEGFVAALPRSTDGRTHTLSVSCAGWMAHAQDEPFTQVFVDRDLSAWSTPPLARRAAAASGGEDQGKIQTSADSSGLAWVPPSESLATGTSAELQYDIGPRLTVGQYSYRGSRVGAFTGFESPLLISATSQDLLTGTATAAMTLDDVTHTAALATPTRYLMLRVRVSVGPVTPAAGHLQRLSQFAVYGSHGLTLRDVGDGGPPGVTASDVIANIASRYCPLLSTSGVRATFYPIGHLVFREHTKPYDAFLKVNSFHLWKLGVWEDRTLYFEPIDLTDWDWEIRHDEAGSQVGLQGDELAALRSGIIVQYTNAATGAVDVLHPDDYPQLRDMSADNPYVAHGRNGYGDPFIIPFPTTAADALALGQVQLAEDNQPKAPGQFAVQGQIKDRAGNYQPVSRVRAGDRIRLTSSMDISDRPRLIQETSYSHDGASVTISVDSTQRALEGYLDRVTTALAAANLSS